MKFLLDTNVISEIRKREQAAPAVADWVQRTPVEDMGTSVVVLAEIRRGIEQKRRRDAAQAQALDRWFTRMRSRLGDRVTPIDEPIADIWGARSAPVRRWASRSDRNRAGIDPRYSKHGRCRSNGRAAGKPFRALTSNPSLG